MTGPSLLPEDPAPEREQVQLGSRVLELEPEQAAAVRQAFQDLAGSYGAAVEQERRRVLESIGTPGWQAPAPGPLLPEAPGVVVPDVDLLFSNKEAWQDALANSLAAQIGAVQSQSTQLVQGALTAVDSEFRRRELQAQAKAIHDNAMEEMLERRNLGDHRDYVQTIYNREYGNLANLPLTMALDQLGAIAEEGISAIRGERREIEPAATTKQTPPALLHSGRNARASHAPAPTPAAKTLSDLIRNRQAIALGTAKAA